MKQLLCSLFLALSVNVCAQDTTFSRIYEPLVGDLSTDRPVLDAAIVWDDGLITSGTTTWNSSTFLTRIDPNGNLVWQKRFNSNSISHPYLLFNQLISTRDSSFVAVGKFLVESDLESRPFCMKLNALGDTLWTRSFLLNNQTIGSFQDVYKDNGKVVETIDSSLLVGFQFASFEQSPANPDHLCLSKLNMDGDVIWSKSFITDSAFLLRGIIQAPDTSFYIIGQSGDDGNYGHLLNVSADGQLNWARKYTGIQFEDIQLDSNNLFITWTINQWQTGLLKLDLNGNHVKRIEYFSQNGAPFGISTARRSNGNLVSVPVEYSLYAPSGFVELDEDLFAVAYYSQSMLMREVVSIPNKGVYAIGFGPIFGVKLGDSEMGVIRFDSLMNVSTDCFYPNPASTITILDSVPSSGAVLLESDSLSFVSTNLIYNNYPFVSETGCVKFFGSVAENERTWNETIFPNPSNGECTISWGEYRDVEWVIYNSIGKEVYRGKTKNSFVEIDLENEQNGLYYYRLADEAGSQSNGKLSLMK